MLGASTAKTNSYLDPRTRIAVHPSRGHGFTLQRVGSNHREFLTLLRRRRATDTDCSNHLSAGFNGDTALKRVKNTAGSATLARFFASETAAAIAVRAPEIVSDFFSAT